MLFRENSLIHTEKIRGLSLPQGMTQQLRTFLLRCQLWLACKGFSVPIVNDLLTGNSGGGPRVFLFKLAYNRNLHALKVYFEFWDM